MHIINFRHHGSSKPDLRLLHQACRAVRLTVNVDLGIWSGAWENALGFNSGLMGFNRLTQPTIIREIIEIWWVIMEVWLILVNDG